MSRINPTLYLGDTFYDLSSEEDIVKIDKEVNTYELQQNVEPSDILMECSAIPSSKNIYTDNQTQHENFGLITSQTQTEFMTQYDGNACQVCGRNMNLSNHMLVSSEKTLVENTLDEDREISPSLTDLCNHQPRNKLLKKNIKAIKNVALNLLDICENPTESDLDNDERILQTLSKNLKTLRSNDPTVCVPVIIRLDKRMAAGEVVPNNTINKSSHSDKSIRFSISRDFADDILDDMENEMGNHIMYRKTPFARKLPSSESDEALELTNVAEKPLTNSSPKDSLLEFDDNKLHNERNRKLTDSQKLSQPGNIPEIARNIRKLLKEKSNGKVKVMKASRDKASKKCNLSPTYLENMNPIDLCSKDPIKLAISINSSNKEDYFNPDLGMCSCAKSSGNTDLVCPFTEQMQCDCLVKLPSFLSKNDI